MEYIDKLKKVEADLDNLESKTKEEVIKFAKLIVKMSINREEGNQYADELIRTTHEQKFENMVKASIAILQSGTDNFNLLYQFKCLTGFKLDGNLLQDLAKGTVIIKSVKED